MTLYQYPHDIESFKLASAIDDKTPKVRESLLKKHKISSAEYDVLLNIMGRTPTFTELGIFSAMWSEHCSYKSSRIHLGRFPTTGSAVIQGPGENAGIARLHGKLGVAFKMESHNHPSYIEPYQGAATGVGGILRDVFCMGARPIANLNCLRFGKRSHKRTPYLFEHVTKGIGDYGNCIGIPTVGGNVSFDETYDGNCLVNAMTVGLIHEDKIFKGYASGVGNLVVYVGSSTGRDGIHGATMASDSFDSKTEGERAAVQVGDPFTEKMLLEATLEVLEKGLVIGLQDMGAAGLTSSSFEMASRAESGLYLNLDLVPTRTNAMSAYELMLSESQERMLMVVEERHWPALKAVCEKWQLAHAVIGVVTDTQRVQATLNGVLEIDVPVAPITDRAPKYKRPIKAADPAPRKTDSALEDKARAFGIEKLFSAMLSDVGRKDQIFRQYDQHIGRKTHLDSDSEGAGVLWIRDPLTTEKPYLGLSVSTACNERYCAVDARLGSTHAVVKAARMLYATGAKPLALTDCLNFGNPEDPTVMAQFSDAVDGVSDACHALAVPVVSGNVSLYNETDGKSIYPTPMIGMVGKVEDIRLSPKAVVASDCTLYLLCADETPTFGGSLTAKHLGEGAYASALPPFVPEKEKAAADFIQRALPKLTMARDIGAGGLALTVTKACLRHNFGFKLEDSSTATLTALFGERSASYLLGFSSDTDAKLFESNVAKGLNFVRLGKASASATDFDFLLFKQPKQQARDADLATHRF